MLRLLLLATCAWAAAGPLEAQPAPKPLASARQTDRELRLDLQAGDYVRGRADAASDASDLVLFGPTGETIRIAPGISWARIPMPGSLGHINSWLLDDADAAGEGVAIVDTGICLTICSDEWKALYAGAL